MKITHVYSVHKIRSSAAVEIIKNDSGSAILMFLLAAAIMGVIMSAMLTIGSNMNRSASHGQHVKTAESFMQALVTIASNDEMCVGDANFAGLKFLPATPGTFDTVTAVTAAGQKISLGTHFQDALGNHISAADGVVFPTLGLKVDHIYIRNAQPIPASPGSYKAEAIGQFTVSGDHLGERSLGDIKMNFSGSTLTGCEVSQTPQVTCQNLGCQYIANPPPGLAKCKCGYPHVTCNKGPNGWDYVKKIDYSTTPPTAICEPFSVSCRANGPGWFVSGIDDNGDPVCQSVEKLSGS